MLHTSRVRELTDEGGVILSQALLPRFLQIIQNSLAPLAHETAEPGVRSRHHTVYAARNVLELCPGVVSAWREPRLLQFVLDVLGPQAGLVRGLYFDKPPEQTWALPWHKDLTIAVKEPVEVPGYSTPRQRVGVWHCEPPLDVLGAMLTLRIHLDDATEENGPLEVLPGSHRTGKSLVVAEFSPRHVLVQAGDVFAMRPLLVHRSGRSRPGTVWHRRVLHLEFSATPRLPGGHEWHTFLPVAADS